MMYKYHLMFLFLLVPAWCFADMEAARQALNNGDHARAAAEFKSMADQGDARAQSHLGYLYYAGEGVPQSYEQAVHWYRKAAVQGNRDAQYNLAVAYAFGEGIKQDYREAAIWYRRAAEQGHAVAQYSLGLSYAYGEGMEQDEKAAAQWFLQSAEQGYENAQVMVASLYHIGDGLPKDYGKAIAWYRKAAERNNAVAQYNLGTLYRAGKGVDKNTEEAVKWYRRAADQGYEPAQTELSVMERALAGAERQPDPAPTAAVINTESPAPATTTATPVIAAATDSPRPTEQSVTEKENQELAVTTDPEANDPGPETAPSTGFFSRLKDFFNPESADAGTAAEATLPAAGTTMESVTGEIPEETGVGTEAIAEAEPTPEYGTIEHDEQPLVVTGEETYKQQSFTSGNDIPSRHAPARSDTAAPQIESQTVQDQITSQQQAAPSATTAPAPVSIPDPALESEPAITSIVAETASATGTETGVETKAKAGGLSGFFGRLFSRSEPETVASGNDTDQPLATIPAPAVTEPPTPAAVSYALDSKPGEQQLAMVGGDAEAPAAEINVANENTYTEPAPTVIELSQPNTTMEKPAVSIPVQNAALTAVEPPPDYAWNRQLMEPEAEEVTVETNPALPQAEATETMQLAAVEVETQTETLATTAEQEMETVTPAGLLDTLQPLAVAGELNSQYELGNLYYTGEEVNRDYDAAFLWYRRAALQGHAEAQYSLGTMYLMGEGTRQNDMEAINWYEKAAAQGHATARHNLENLRRVVPEPESATVKTAESIPAEPVKATATTTQSSVTNIEPVTVLTTAQSHYERGLAYSHGDGVPRNDTNAFKYFQSAAAAGHAPAQYQLGMAYNNGQGVEKDMQIAIEWYEKSARQGYAMAQRSLCNIYLNGAAGVPPNKALALAWYNILAGQGKPMDIHRRDVLEKQLTEEDLQEAARLQQQLTAGLSTASTTF